MGHPCLNAPRRQTPPTTRTSDLTIAEVAGRWWLLHTKARCEKALAWDLCDLALDYFLPLVRTPRVHGGRRVEVDLPLFSGYLFFAATTDEDRYRVLTTNRVVSVIEVVDQDRLKTELEHVRRAVASSERVRLFPGIRKGRRCRVNSGSLKGIEGVVIRRGNTGRVFLDVAMLGQSAVVEVDMTLLTPID